MHVAARRSRAILLRRGGSRAASPRPTRGTVDKRSTVADGPDRLRAAAARTSRPSPHVAGSAAQLSGAQAQRTIGAKRVRWSFLGRRRSRSDLLGSPALVRQGCRPEDTGEPRRSDFRGRRRVGRSWDAQPCIRRGAWLRVCRVDKPALRLARRAERLGTRCERRAAGMAVSRRRASVGRRSAIPSPRQLIPPVTRRAAGRRAASA